jgi:hypothetical protein
LRYSISLVLILLALTPNAGSQAAQPTNPCVMSAPDVAWLKRALDAWHLSLRDTLHVTRSAEPLTTVFFDMTCVYRGTADIARKGEPHDGAIRLPDGKTLPPQVASFAAPYDDNRRTFMAMALPEIWRAAGVNSELTLETLMVSVFVHEMTHTRQFAVINQAIDGFAERYKLGDDLNDDMVQNRFRDTPEFVADIDAERALLFRAAAASTTDADARAAAREALARINARRARHYTGDDVKFSELEDVFLTMEGVGQWAAYKWLVHPKGGGFAPENALPWFRRGGRQWSQDEGLAIFLVIDRLVPGWTPRVFEKQPATALRLLAEAAR